MEVSRRWERGTLDPLVADIFGFHALQVGALSFEGLSASRMPHRWYLAEAASHNEPAISPEAFAGGGRTVLRAEPVALPFPANAIDLVLMPHTLEHTADPHAVLREAERVLVPEGRLVITAFNPVGLWGTSRWWHGRRGGELASGDWLTPWRLRDWLRLLNFEVEISRFGCFAPPWAPQPWHLETHWSQRVADRWFPMVGGVYALVAVKRVPGVRLLGLGRQRHRHRHRTAAVAGVRVTGAQASQTMKESPDGND